MNFFFKFELIKNDDKISSNTNLSRYFFSLFFFKGLCKLIIASFQPILSNISKIYGLCHSFILENFYKHANISDMARIKCLNNNGAMSWLNVMYNYEFTRLLSNQQVFIALSLVSGLPIFTHSNLICNRCKKSMDINGHHCLHCPNGKWTEKRHDAIVNVLFKYLRKAGYICKKEQRYDDSGNRRMERPGDIMIENWNLGDDEIGKLYMDITIGNIFADTYVSKCAKKRLWLAEELESRKEEKYKNKDNIKGLGLEVLGGMSDNFKAIIQRIAENLELRTQIVQSIWMNKIRSTIMMELNCLSL